MSGDDAGEEIVENGDKLPIPTGDVMADSYIELRDEIVKETISTGTKKASRKRSVRTTAKRKKKIVGKKKTPAKRTRRLKPRK